MEKDIRAIKYILFTIGIMIAYGVTMLVADTHKENPAVVFTGVASLVFLQLCNLLYLLGSNIRRV